jgi:hypothetical protein
MFGTFVGGTFGVEQGIVLSTGDVEKLNARVQELSTDFGLVGAVGDVATLIVNFELIEPLFLSFDWVVASRELPQFGGSAYNDEFDMNLNGVPIAKLSNGRTVSINNLVPYPDSPSDWSPDYNDNPNKKFFGFTGYTNLLKASGQGQLGRNALNVSVIDISDGLLDTVVFLKGGSLRVTTQYYWNPMAWSSCQPSCGPDSMRTRTLRCEASDGSVATDADCANIPASDKPTESEKCGAAPACQYQYGEWEACTATCDNGSGAAMQKRSVSCQGPDGDVVSNVYCPREVEDTKPCTGLPSCPLCEFGAWSTCSQTCGGGTQTRSLPDACPDAVKTETQACSANPCPVVCNLPGVITGGPGYDISACNTPIDGSLLADQCALKCAPGYTCEGPGCSADGSITVSCTATASGAAGEFGLGATSCKPPFTPAPTMAFTTAFLNFAKFTLVAAPGSMNTVRKNIFLEVLSDAFSETTTPAVFAKFTSESSKGVDGNDVETMEMTVGMLPDMIEGTDTIVQNVQENLETVAKNGKLDQLMKNQGYVITKVETVCSQAMSYACAAKTLSFNKEFFYPGFTDYS